LNYNILQNQTTSAVLNPPKNKRTKRSSDFCQKCGKQLYRHRGLLCTECRTSQVCKICGDKQFRKALCHKHWIQQKKRTKCSVPGCEELSRDKGLCNKHYKEHRTSVLPICSVDGCGCISEKRGLCGKHYQSWRVKNNTKVCKNPECDRKTFKHGLCFAHWKLFDPFRAFIRAIRVRITNSVNLRYKKNDSAENMIGMKLTDVRSYIESKFKPSMSWGNYGEWHIDHICPCSQATSEEELIKLQHYTNLQPLWSHENFAKCDNVSEEAKILCLELLGRPWE